MLIRKTLPHQKCVSSSPPSVRADHDADAGHGRPGGDGLRALLRREDRVQDRQHRQHDERRAQAHHDPRAGQHAGAGSERRRGAAEGEHGQAAEQLEQAPVPVAERPGRDQQRREAQRVGVGDPLQRAGPRVQHPGESGQGRVQDGVVDHDDEQAQAEHQQDQPAQGVTRWPLGVGRVTRSGPGGRAAVVLIRFSLQSLAYKCYLGAVSIRR